MESFRRILALWLPRLSTDRLRRRWKAAGRLIDRPLVVAAKIDNALRLTAVDEAAAKLGLHPGKALADARAMVPDIAVIRANETADFKLLESIAGWCERYTPLVALDAPQGLLLDITGAGHLFGGEQAMAEEIHRDMADLGFSVRLALAGTAESARALAHYAPGTLVPPGCESDAVAGLPTQALNADPPIIHALKRAGLKTIGQVASRSRHELAGRFGGAFVALIDRTLGRNGGPITPRMPLPDLMAERRFPEPVLMDAAVNETLDALGRTLASMLESRGQGARMLEAAFFRADGEMRRIAVETGRATRDAPVFTRLLREKLGSLADPLDPGFGFDLIRLSVILALDLEAKNVDLYANAVDAEADFLVDRLAARFGPHRVLRFLPQDTHIPEAETIAVPARSVRGCKQPWPRHVPAGVPRRPLRFFAKPEPVEVLAEVPDGPPLRFRWRSALHSVIHAEGPERIAMEWWRHRGLVPTRDYFRVEDETGKRFWLYRDGIHGRELSHPRWYVHGLFA